MKGDPKIIEHLNKALKKELAAINQYFLHARLLEDWGLAKMAKHEYDESIEEMRHADKLIQRIILLGGHPNLQEIGGLNIGENVEEVLNGDLKLEVDGITHYREAIGACEQANDYVTRDLFIEILTDEEGHQDFLETQLEMIKQMGLQNYIHLQSAPTNEQESTMPAA